MDLAENANGDVFTSMLAIVMRSESVTENPVHMLRQNRNKSGPLPTLTLVSHNKVEFSLNTDQY